MAGRAISRYDKEASAAPRNAAPWVTCPTSSVQSDYALARDFSGNSLLLSNLRADLITISFRSTPHFIAFVPVHRSTFQHAPSTASLLLVTPFFSLLARILSLHSSL